MLHLQLRMQYTAGPAPLSTRVGVSPPGNLVKENLYFFWKSKILENVEILCTFRSKIYPRKFLQFFARDSPCYGLWPGLTDFRITSRTKKFFGLRKKIRHFFPLFRPTLKNHEMFQNLFLNIFQQLAYFGFLWNSVDEKRISSKHISKHFQNVKKSWKFLT